MSVSLAFGIHARFSPARRVWVPNGNFPCLSLVITWHCIQLNMLPPGLPALHVHFAYLCIAFVLFTEKIEVPQKVSKNWHVILKAIEQWLNNDWRILTVFINCRLIPLPLILACRVVRSNKVWSARMNFGDSNSLFLGPHFALGKSITQHCTRKTSSDLRHAIIYL